mgnify:CR=1 FL=1
MDLKIFLGTVNYTDYLHWRIELVSAPGTTVDEGYINVPVTNYTLVISGLTADNYNVFFYDSPDTSSLGTLVTTCFISAVSAAFEYEQRFYRIGSLPSGASISGDMKTITDPYLIGKAIQSYFRQGNQFLEDGVDIGFDNSVGDMALLDGTSFSTGEVLSIQIKNAI